MTRYDFSRFALPVQRSKRDDWMPFVARLGSNAVLQERVQKLGQRIAARLDAVNMTTPTIDGKSTNPFVLAAFARAKGIAAPAELDVRLAAAKEFSSLETALGRVVEDIVPQVYGWEKVETPGHSPLSEIDCAILDRRTVRLCALKSGPMCVNDSMVFQIGNAIATNCTAWAQHWGVSNVEFTIGMNYSTARSSNKKDWHAVRLAEQKLAGQGHTILKSCIQPGPLATSRQVALPEFKADVQGVNLTVRTRQGIELWDYIAAPITDAYLEVCAGLVLGSIKTATLSNENARLTTRNLAQVLELPIEHRLLAGGFFSPAQIQWFFLFARHFVDELAA